MNNQVIYELPEGVYIPRVKSNVYKYVAYGVLLTIIGLFFPPLLIIATILLFIGIKNMIFDREFNSSLNTQLAIKQYQNGNFESCLNYANKALKYDPNNEPARILINYIENFT